MPILVLPADGASLGFETTRRGLIHQPGDWTNLARFMPLGRCRVPFGRLPKVLDSSEGVHKKHMISFLTDGHLQGLMPLRRWDTRARKHNHHVGRLIVPLFAKSLS
jgi:hypothetical protein